MEAHYAVFVVYARSQPDNVARGNSCLPAFALIPWLAPFSGFGLGLWHTQELYRFIRYNGAKIIMGETILSFLLGIGLSAAVGFRIFVPMLLVSLASMVGVIQLAPGFQWMGTPVAALVFAVATLAELLGFLVPWVSNALDAIATPAATIAGVVMMAAVLTNLDPLLRWTFAIIAGGGTALTVQGATVVTRAVAAGSTGGAANPLVAILEAIGALVVTITTIVIPAIMGILVLIVVLLLLRLVIPKFRAIRAGRRAESKP